MLRGIGSQPQEYVTLSRIRKTTRSLRDYLCYLGMPLSAIPCLSLAITPLQTDGQFAIHITHAPLPSGYVLNDRPWSEGLTQLWQAWQEMFSARGLPNVPLVSEVNAALPDLVLPLNVGAIAPTLPVGRAGRLMQHLGISLWQWLFDGSIQGSLKESQGIAMGQGKPLRVRLDIRDPDLIAMPWEIMQDGAGKQAVALSQQLLFSRTTNDVAALPLLRTDHALKVLLVLGQDAEPSGGTSGDRVHSLPSLKLEQEAAVLAEVLMTCGTTGTPVVSTPPCQVDTLIQPTPAELIQCLETGQYNIFFYAGHGMPAADGGLLFLRPDMTLNGTELAQVLTRCQVKLAVFNACWGAQPEHYHTQPTPGVSATAQAIPRSSLAEVLIHHGVPAVLGMRDSITDEEALSFIQAFAKALAERLPIDQSVAVARQHLLTLYKFNQQAWTLPVLYMHPEFEGELLKPIEENLTQLPGMVTRVGPGSPKASLRSLNSAKAWQIRGGMMRVGRDSLDNDLVLEEAQGGVSRKHAVIFCRQLDRNGKTEATYFLEDISRFGTWVLCPDLAAQDWQKIHRQEVRLPSGARLKFGSSQNETLEFVVHSNSEGA